MPLDEQKVNKLTKDAQDRQLEVRDAIESRKGKLYADEVQETGEILAILWGARREMAGSDKWLDKASERVLLFGCMNANPDGANASDNERVALLLEFTSDVKSVSQHMILRVTAEDIGLSSDDEV